MDTSWISSRSVLAISVVAILIYATYRHAGAKLDPREPPVVQSPIPYIGHVIGMITTGGRYTKSISRNHRPIFTLPMPGSRMYIVTDPALAAIVQKTKSLSFNPIIPEVTQRVLGLSEQGVQVLKTNIGRENGPNGFYPEVHDLVYSNMTPGDLLDDLTTRATDMFRKHLLQYAQQPSPQPPPAPVQDLLLWTQNLITHATAEFLYGPHHPLSTNPHLTTSFWDFDHGLGQLLAFANLFPSLTARKAYLGREAVISSLLTYFQSNHHQLSAPLIRQRLLIAQKHGMEWDDIARSELSFLFAGIVNTAITSFWLLIHIYARPDLLAEIRQELSFCTTTTTTTTTTTIPPTKSKPASPTPLNPAKIATSCPLLHSTYRETLRVNSDNSSNRLATSDTLLGDKYYVAKGSMIQISGAAMHVDSTIWGSDVDRFDERRFLPENLKTRSIHPSAFRAFGGGNTVCPARHFAGREIMYFVALVLNMFDIEDVDGGAVKIPEKKDNVLPVHILEPRGKVMVVIKLRATNST